MGLNATKALPADFADFTIRDGPDGAKCASAEGLVVTVLPDADDARICHRRSLRPFAPGGAIRRSVLRCDLAGVHVYIQPRSEGGYGVVVTTQRLRP